MSYPKKNIPAPVVFPVIDPNQKYCTVAEAAVYIRRSKQFVRARMHSGELKTCGISRPYIFDRIDLDRFMTARKIVVGAYRTGTRPWVAARLAKARQKKVA